MSGIVGYGRLLATGRIDLLPTLYTYANDLRWRMREAVVLGLQELGTADMPAFLDLMEPWSRRNPFEQRAAAAMLCEPKLLIRQDYAERVLAMLDATPPRSARAPTARARPSRRCAKGLATAGSVPSRRHRRLGSA